MQACLSYLAVKKGCRIFWNTERGWNTKGALRAPRERSLKLSRRARKSYTGTARDSCRACLARVLYSMRHACSTRSLGHANVRKTCSINSGHHFVPTPPLCIRRRHACTMRLLRAAWLQLTLRHSPSSSVLILSRADVLVVGWRGHTSKTAQRVSSVALTRPRERHRQRE